MRRTLLLAAVLGGLLTAALAPGASAEPRKCYTPHVGSYPTYEVCHYLPIDLEPQG